MTGELIQLPTFDGRLIRVTESNGEPWFPLEDLSLALGLDRTTLRNHVDRNKDMFEGCVMLVDKKSSSDPNLNKELISVNEEGLYLLLARISTGRLKNPIAKETIKRFRKESSRLIQQYRKKEIAPVMDIKAELRQAREEAEICGCESKTLCSAVYRKHGEIEKAENLLQSGPAIVHGETGWYTVTQLVALCNDPDLTPERLNWYLRNKGYQVKESGLWRLEPSGRDHGREYWFTAPSGHGETRIAWRESILYASGLKRPMANDQAALPARAGS